ncbi:MAG: hypothetical protein NTU41_01590 [Chloroflexi bacterium]|nr:hypothetical protein [Chloroflexota bacterium]
MSRADAIRNLAEEMAQSQEESNEAQEERAKRVAEIRSEAMAIEQQAVELVQNLHQAHAEMGAKIRADLSSGGDQRAKGEKERKKTSQVEAKQRAAAIGEINDQVAALRKQVDDLLRSLDKAHAEMSASLGAELSSGRDERGKSEAERKKMCESEAANRSNEAKQRTAQIAEIDAKVAALKKQSDDFLHGLEKAHAEMSASLKRELSAASAQRAEAETEREKTFQAEAANRSSEVKARSAVVQKILSEASELVKRLQTESTETAAAWRELISTMQARRGKGTTPSRVEPPQAPTGPAPVAAAAQDEVMNQPEMPEEVASLQNKILELIGQRPQGVKLTEIAEAMGEARVKVGNITRMLVAEGKLIKDGLLYSIVA